ncbi:hypothetical protein AVEN_30811-1 [Araneus ventricosus]|uniref:Uncharacterized protein n=1 Tax=Araneus ventricosus TaxID=182803 RepID=A0A4Y2KVM4_ARAVE|nr:hypothetical protein AVEN_30811-1 [Araneus ventricosus]
MADAKNMIFRINFDNLSIIENVSEARANNFTFYLETQSGSLPKLYPKSLKEIISQKVTTTKYIEEVLITRQGKSLLKTQNHHTAKELYYIEAIIGIPIRSKIRIEDITSRFLLQNIEQDSDLYDLKEEFEAENNIKIYELRRFGSRKNANNPSDYVLVTIFGIIVPEYIKKCGKDAACEKCREGFPGQDHSCNKRTFKCINCSARRLFRPSDSESSFAEVCKKQIDQRVSKEELSNILKEHVNETQMLIQTATADQAKIFNSMFENFPKSIFSTALQKNAQSSVMKRPSTQRQGKNLRSPILLKLTKRLIPGI